MSKCRSCGAEIIWIRMTSGKSMPCNAEQVMYWEKRGGKEKIVTLNGEVISCEFAGELNRATGLGYISHFSTCPNANQHRKRGQQE